MGLHQTVSGVVVEVGVDIIIDTSDWFIVNGTAQYVHKLQL